MAHKRRANGLGSLYQRTTKGAWIASWYDDKGKRRERTTGTTDKAAAERILRKRVTDAALRRDNVIDAGAESLSAQGRRPIAEHFADWQSALENKGTSAKQVKLVTTRADVMLRECGFSTLAEVEPANVQGAIRLLQSDDLSARTINRYLQSLIQFLRWCVDDRRLASNPLAGIASVKVIGQTYTRRPLDADELSLMIATTDTAPIWRNMTGADRAMLYRVATGTGFRASELASLTPSSFDVKSDTPAVTVRAAYSKRRRDDRQPIRFDLAGALRPWLAHRPAGAPVFAMPDRTAEMIRRDLRPAKARYIRQTADRADRRDRRRDGFLAPIDDEGRVVDFHSLRATYITMLVRSGASVKVAQELARHSDPKLTMNVYTRLGVHDLAAALDRLPALQSSEPATESLATTGTYDVAGNTSSSNSSSSANRGLVNATRRVERSAVVPDDDARKPLSITDKREVKRTDAPEKYKATDGTRTRNLRFTNRCTIPQVLNLQQVASAPIPTPAVATATSARFRPMTPTCAG